MPKSARDPAIILLLVAAALILFFSSMKDTESTKPAILYSFFAPVQNALNRVVDEIKAVWTSYIYLRNTADENKKLKEDLEKLRQVKLQLDSKEIENRRYKKLLDLKADYEFPTIVAAVIGEDASGWYRNIFINRGADAGITTEMPVVSHSGLVGRVVKVAPHSAKVLLLTDPGFGVDCRIVRTRERGILSGSFENRSVLRYLNLNSTVTTGDDVVTSGLDGIFPRGIPVGKVVSVRKGSQDLFLEAMVTPYSDFSGVEEVLIIMGRAAGFDLRPGLDHTK